jgi:hypothetical protein
MLEILGRLKERRPSPSIIHEAFAIKAPLGDLWLGVYQSPTTGVRYAKDKSGNVEKFQTAQAAELAASRQLHKELDKRAPLKVTKEIVVTRSSSRASRRAKG